MEKESEMYGDGKLGVVMGKGPDVFVSPQPDMDGESYCNLGQSYEGVKEEKKENMEKEQIQENKEIQEN